MQQQTEAWWSCPSRSSQVMQGKCCFVFTAPLIWQQFKVKLEKFLCQCKVCCNNWKLWGDHGAIKLLEDDKNENWLTNRPLPFLTLQEQTKCCCIFMSLCTNGHKLSRRQLKHHQKRLFERGSCHLNGHHLAHEEKDWSISKPWKIVKKIPT